MLTMISCEKNAYSSVFAYSYLFVNPFPQPVLSFFPPSSYPDDPPLFFEEFPEHDNWISADTMTEDEKRTLNEIKYSKFSLGIAKENAKDYLTSKYGVAPKQLAKCAAIPVLIGVGPALAPDPLSTECYVNLIVEMAVTYYLLQFVYWGSKLA